MRKCISFKEKERDLYNYLISKRNASDYIKDLIEADMGRKEEKPISSNAEKEEFSW